MSEPVQSEGQLVEVELATGEKVKVAPEHAEAVKANAFRQADYTRKTQQLADERRQFAEERAKLADVQAKLNIIEKNPGLKAQFEQTFQNPWNTVTPQGDDDPFAETSARDNALAKRLAQLEGYVGNLNQQLTQRERQSMRFALQAELANKWGNKPYVDLETCLVHAEANPGLWGMPVDGMAAALVTQLYPNEFAQDLRNQGRAEIERELEKQRAEEAETERLAANTPSQVSMPDGSAIPSDTEILRMQSGTPEEQAKAHEYLLRVEQAHVEQDKARRAALQRMAIGSG